MALMTRRATMFAFVALFGCTRPEPRTIDNVAADAVQAINAGDADRLYAMCDPEMKAALPLPEVRAFVKDVNASGRLSSPRRSDKADLHRTYVVVTGKGEEELDLHIDEGGRITGFRLKPKPPEPVIASSTLPIGLPFSGEWLVFWGGTTPETNYHVTSAPSDRRAADLVKVNAEGKERSGEGNKNTDYFTYGAEVVAVADGVVIEVVDGVPDNEPGVMNPDHLGGNDILIAHAGGMHSYYAHLQREKHRVKRGDHVKRGAVIGIAGNSGNSSQPHLHFQLQNGPDSSAVAIEAVFDEVVVLRDGKRIVAKNYRLLKGDRVARP
jgi:murein DD-endopeptidase MepM/ murein hydrolase activator NlpD